MMQPSFVTIETAARMTAPPPPAQDGLTGRDFVRLAGLIEQRLGIRMPPNKQTMLEGRLRKRVRALDLADINAYCRFLFDQGGFEQEFVHLVDAVTTNKTDFFREPAHFDFLAGRVVPALMEQGAGLARPLLVWSAACSSGPEPYTIAMVLSDLAEQSHGLRFSVLASDISTEMLETARRAVYPEDMAAPVPEMMRRRYLMRSRDPKTRLARVVPELRQLVAFHRLNLLDRTWPWQTPMDVVFCRNVLIYFGRDTQQQVLSQICRHLRRGGFLFVGHSETLTGLTLPVEPVAPAVYRRV